MRVRAIARAKINPYLAVLGRRDDGYSSISTVMQSIDWHDTLAMERAVQSSVRFSPVEYSDAIERPDLVERALEIFNQTVEGTQGAEVTVAKTIPIGAGLGGGSADAAAALRGMAALAGGAADEALLLEIAAQVGSDVPFALIGGAAIATGRGEVLKSVPSPKTTWVIGVPDFSLSTREIYERARELSVGSEDAAEEVASALVSGDVDVLSSLLHNDLEPAALDVRPELGELKDSMVKAGALGTVMSGSGSSIVGLCRDPEHAQHIAEQVRPSFGRGVRVCSSVAAGAEVIA